MNRLVSVLCALCAFVVSTSAASRPNILVVLADDLGFSDLGCYGSEIDTPNLDRLASNGLRFTQFYNTAKCHSSRVSLLTGRWCRQAGDQSLARAVTIPEVLQPAGYFTAMTGKWHLSKQPTDFGFQRYFGHLSGVCNYYKGDRTFRLNGEPWQVPEKGFYTTIANVDYALKFLGDARAEKKPWFLYVAFNAPHAPLQPKEVDYKKYLGRYNAGWDVIREARLAKQRKLGLFGGDVTPSPRPDHIPAWSALKPDVQKWEARRMAAYAALIDRVDQELGRLIADLKQRGELDNTLILFFSDNGACPYDRRSTDADREPYNPEVTWSDSTGWAWARNSPFRYYKQNQFEGGIATPAIVHWPAGIKAKPGTLVHTPAHLVDVFPTLAEVAGAKVPDTYPERELTPLAGVSFAPVLAGKPAVPHPPIHLLFASDRGLRDGDWKLVSFQSQPWELYNLAKDRTELNNVAAQHPDITARMVKQWTDMAENVLSTPAKERGPVAATATDHRHNEWSNYGGDTTSSRKGEPKGKAKKAAKKGKTAPVETKIRARRDTTLRIEGGELVLSCSDGDPGLAFDTLNGLRSGPYELTFRVSSNASGGGEVYFTTDAQTKLPNGKHIEFSVAHDGQWHDARVAIDTKETLYALRLDLCTGAGEVRIQGLTLRDEKGVSLMAWPAASR